MFRRHYMYSMVAAFSLLAVGLVSYWTHSYIIARELTGKDLSVLDYRHDGPGSAMIKVQNPVGAALSVVLVPETESLISVDPPGLVKALLDHNARSLSAGKEGKYQIVFPIEREHMQSEQSYVLVILPTACMQLPRPILQKMIDVDECRPIAFLELVRQSPSFLRTIGLNRPEGYTIAGRTDIHFPHAEISLPSQVKPRLLQHPFSEWTLPADIAARLQTVQPEILEAARIVSYMYDKPVRTGPIQDSYEKFLLYPATDRLAQLRSGEYAVMCAGFRDIWAELAGQSPEIAKVRQIAAYNYYPPIPDLETYSHAVAEFWVEGLKKWILIDPWFGFLLRLNGEFLGIDDLLILARERQKEIEVVPLVRKVRRFTNGLDGELVRLEGNVEAIAPPLTTVVPASGYRIGYLDYFRAIGRGEAMLKPG